MTAQETVCAVVRLNMEMRGESQAALGRAIGMSEAAVSRRFTGESRWTLEDLEALAAHYALPVSALVPGVLTGRYTHPPQRTGSAADYGLAA